MRISDTAFIDPRASSVGGDVTVGSRCFIGEYAMVTADIGERCFIGPGATVQSRLPADCMIGPHATISAGIRIGERLHLMDGAHLFAGVGDSVVIGHHTNVRCPIPRGIHVPGMVDVPECAVVRADVDLGVVGRIGSAHRNCLLYRVADGSTRITAGCWNSYEGGTPEELRRRVLDGPEEWECCGADLIQRWTLEYMAACDFAEAWAASRPAWDRQPVMA